MRYRFNLCQTEYAITSSVLLEDEVATLRNEPQAGADGGCWEKKTELGFVWGNIWIALCFIQSIVFLILSFGVLPEYGGLIVGYLFLSVTAFSSSVGLLKRKLWGLYITYFAIILNYFICGTILFTTATELDLSMPFSYVVFPLFIVGWFWFDLSKTFIGVFPIIFHPPGLSKV